MGAHGADEKPSCSPRGGKESPLRLLAVLPDAAREIVRASSGQRIPTATPRSARYAPQANFAAGGVSTIAAVPLASGLLVPQRHQIPSPQVHVCSDDPEVC